MIEQSSGEENVKCYLHDPFARHAAPLFVAAACVFVTACRLVVPMVDVVFQVAANCSGGFMLSVSWVGRRLDLPVRRRNLSDYPGAQILKQRVGHRSL